MQQTHVELTTNTKTAHRKKITSKLHV